MFKSSAQGGSIALRLDGYDMQESKQAQITTEQRASDFLPI